MKPITTTLLAALMLLAISCKKESSSLQSSVIIDESNSRSLLSDANQLVGVQSVRIGTQRWKTKNLDVRHYRNGDHIPQVTDHVKWARLTTGAWCWYNNDSATGHVYGRLYNWYAVNDPRGLAPEGWHIPSDAEWTEVSTFLLGEEVAGRKMKEAGTTHWDYPFGSNSSGFTALPGGFRGNRYFSGVGSSGAWWSSTEYNNSALLRSLYSVSGGIYRGRNDKRYGFSVRCVKDKPNP